MHPSLPFNAPLHAPLTPHVRQLYLRTLFKMQHALHNWCNPWKISSSCFFGYGLKDPACYNYSLHQIQLSQFFKYWSTVLDIFLPVRAAFELARRGEFDQIPWDRVQQKTLQTAADYKELLEEVLTQGMLPSLSFAWSRFEEQLPRLLDECRRQRTLTEDCIAWETAFQDLEVMLRKSLQATFIHEIVHAWTQRRRGKDGKNSQCFIGLMELRAGDPVAFHLIMHESLTEWIAQRVYWQIYEEEPDFTWRESRMLNAYPSWIIEYMVKALDHEWPRIQQGLPLLAKHQVRNATELLYISYFIDNKAVAWLKDALTMLTGNTDAFSIISEACECFFPRADRDRVDIEETLKNMRQVLGPYIQGEILPAPIWL